MAAAAADGARSLVHPAGSYRLCVDPPLVPARVGALVLRATAVRPRGHTMEPLSSDLVRRPIALEWSVVHSPMVSHGNEDGLTSAFEAEFGFASAGDVVASVREFDNHLGRPSDNGLFAEMINSHRTVRTPSPVLGLSSNRSKLMPRHRF